VINHRFLIHADYPPAVKTPKDSRKISKNYQKVVLSVIMTNVNCTRK